MLWTPVLKVLGGLALAVLLVWFATRKLRSRQGNGRTFRTLPGNLVQEIADRLDQPDDLLAFLKEFFGAVYQGLFRSRAIREGKTSYRQRYSTFLSLG